MKQKFIQNPQIWVLLSLTLGLAPFLPEPHLWGKIKWIAGGAVGMKPIDWFDFLMHGTPVFILVFWIILKTLSLIKPNNG